MAFSRFFIIYITFTILLASSSASPSELTHMGFLIQDSRSSCRGSVEECLASSEDFELDSESSRRILATTRYISYGALQKNNVPCSRRGASYYNCRPGAQANPYSRGCSAITRCRR